ncbi:GNAT family N-acetyltransferase [Actinokineospora enzanensis]|uniref:GNAT family N-acetyltransferase n=1 Tax=Actinokineospora enzanensis TaxID=155975 RepID=UPI0003664FE6|nr:GNAT family N-acetyltransferase [Actinokineospora enzanensis]
MFEIGAAGAEDLVLIGEWAHEEGWNPGRSDALAFGVADPGGFLVGRLSGDPVACVSAVRYGAGFGFIGLYIARPPVRGQGYGLRLWNAAMTRLSGRLVGLDGVVAQQANYAKSGFVRAWNNVRFEGVPSTVDAGVRVVDARAVPFDRLAAYDRRFFPAERDSFLAAWIAMPDHITAAALRDGELCGLAVARPCRGVPRIGPWYADSPSVAAALLSAVGSGTRVAVDVPDANPAAVELVTGMGFTPTFEAARMYTGPAPAVDLSSLFGVASLELG